MGSTFADNRSEVVSRRNMFRAVGSLCCQSRPRWQPQTVTGDETWIHHWDLDTKQESMQWTHVDSPPPKKFRTQPSTGKIMATIIWDCRGVLLVDYLPRKTTMCGTYFGEVLRNLREAVKEKRRGTLTRRPLLLQDHASTQATKDVGFQQLTHQP